MQMEEVRGAARGGSEEGKEGRGRWLGLWTKIKSENDKRDF